jgi:hypothetical protein
MQYAHGTHWSAFEAVAQTVLLLRCHIQDYYVKEWADNFMVVMGVDDVEAWRQQARKVTSSGEFDNIRVKPPEAVDDSLVLHVVDPSGVLLVFVQ